jgi:hypothetical protein
LTFSTAASLKEIFWTFMSVFLKTVILWQIISYLCKSVQKYLTFMNKVSCWSGTYHHNITLFQFKTSLSHSTNQKYHSWSEMLSICSTGSVVILTGIHYIHFLLTVLLNLHLHKIICYKVFLNFILHFLWKQTWHARKKITITSLLFSVHLICCISPQQRPILAMWPSDVPQNKRMWIPALQKLGRTQILFPSSVIILQ